MHASPSCMKDEWENKDLYFERHGEEESKQISQSFTTSSVQMNGNVYC